jgi:hypothetical protein
VTEPAEDFEARLTRGLKAGAAELSVGQTVPPFASPHALASRIGPRRRTVRRKVAIAGVAVGLALTGTAAAATIVHLTSAPVTETDLARCYTVDSLAGGNDFRGSSVTAAGPIGSNAQVTNALSACTLLWQDGLLTPGSANAGANMTPSQRAHLNPDHPVPSLVVCVLPGGVAGVFPGNKETCQTLGLPPAEGY